LLIPCSKSSLQNREPFFEVGRNQVTDQAVENLSRRWNVAGLGLLDERGGDTAEVIVGDGLCKRAAHRRYLSATGISWPAGIASGKPAARRPAVRRLIAVITVW